MNHHLTRRLLGIARRPLYLFWLSLFLLGLPLNLNGQIFQWTDHRGVIHFTDNPHSLPAHVKDSPYLVVRRELRTENVSAIPIDAVTFSSDVPSIRPAEIVPSSESGTTGPEGVNYNTENTTIVVVNSITVRPHRHKPCPIPAGCRPAFHPNFDDRKYIHPSVFDGGSRQYIHPGSFQPARK
ncbi:MAG: DUF4124 domain-containing protein [Deltaproteobacteria bacterium]|nr:DUF4124 domain-containing protein [Deltaproteobacteria bacterium]